RRTLAAIAETLKTSMARVRRILSLTSLSRGAFRLFWRERPVGFRYGQSFSNRNTLVHQGVEAGKHWLGLRIHDKSLPARLQTIIHETQEVIDRSELASGRQNRASSRAHSLAKVGEASDDLRLDGVGAVFGRYGGHGWQVFAHDLGNDRHPEPAGVFGDLAQALQIA